MTQTGKFKRIAIVSGGDFLGEGSLSRSQSDHIRPANALVLEDVNLLVLKREKFDKLLKTDPDVALDFIYKILEVTYNRLRFSNSELVTLYEVGRLIGLYLEDLHSLSLKILQQIKEVTRSNRAIMVIKDNLTKKKEIVWKLGDFGSFNFDKFDQLVPQFINDLDKVEKYGLWKQKMIFVPMQEIGYILLTRSEQERDYTDSHLKLLESVASQSRSAIERSRKIRDEKAKKLYERRKVQYNF